MKLLPLILATTLLPMTLSAGEPSPPPMPPPPGVPPMPPVPPAPGMQTEAPSKHVMFDAAQLKWGDAPPALERGAQAVVLAGDPSTTGPFVLRLKAPSGYKVATHWHPTDELVTLIAGDLTLTMDAHAPGEHAHTFSPGGFALLPAKMHLAASTKGGATIQISGMGPFELNYVDAKDDPRLRAPKR
ncbi:MAG: cupin domain-containing protein [Lysobacter sp.]